MARRDDDCEGRSEVRGAEGEEIRLTTHLNKTQKTCIEKGVSRATEESIADREQDEVTLSCK